MKKLWFKNKTYGFGWTPASWEGWLLLAIYVFFIIGSVEKLARKGAFGNIVWIAFVTVLFLWITGEHGERPKWSWGSKKENRKHTETKKEE
jgi:hypothetical protein